MRTRQRTAQTIYYRLYTGKAEVVDGDGYATGEYELTYADPVAFHANVSPAYGEDASEIFGTLERYDKVIQTCDMTCPIDEDSVLYIDTAPVERRDGTWSAHDYVVKRVARSINTIRYAVDKVKVTAPEEQEEENLIDLTLPLINEKGAADYAYDHLDEVMYICADLTHWEYEDNIFKNDRAFADGCLSFMIPCEEGDKFDVLAADGMAKDPIPLFAFIDSGGIVLDRPQEWRSGDVVTAPKGAASVAIEWGLDDYNIGGWVVRHSA